jgi:hypothetical protein
MQKWQVENLARNGGFSDRYIASYVFHCRFEKVTDVQKAAVTRYRAVVEVKLTHWRNGLTPLAQQHARTVVKPPVKFNKHKRKRA